MDLVISAGKSSFFFAIPLRSKAASDDWGRVCRLLEATLRSVLRQSDPDFTVLIAGHDVPEVSGMDDPRVVFLPADFATPRNYAEQMRDKGRKRRLISAEVGRRGGGFLMLLDSDDLVSRRLLEHARRHDDANGYVIRNGYIYNQATQGFKKLPEHFDQCCGSCIIFRFAVDDLPKHADDPASYYCDRFTVHTRFVEEAAAMGRPLAEIPFPAAVYLVNHGENHSIRSGNAHYRSPLNLPAPLMRIVNTIVPGRGMPRRLAQEFGM